MKCAKPTCTRDIVIVKPDCHNMRTCEQCEQDARNYCLRGKMNNKPCVEGDRK